MSSFDKATEEKIEAEVVRRTRAMRWLLMVPASMLGLSALLAGSSAYDANLHKDHAAAQNLIAQKHAERAARNAQAAEAETEKVHIQSASLQTEVDKYTRLNAELTQTQAELVKTIADNKACDKSLASIQQYAAVTKKNAEASEKYLTEARQMQDDCRILADKKLAECKLICGAGKNKDLVHALRSTPPLSSNLERKGFLLTFLHTAATEWTEEHMHLQLIQLSRAIALLEQLLKRFEAPGFSWAPEKPLLDQVATENPGNSCELSISHTHVAKVGPVVLRLTLEQGMTTMTTGQGKKVAEVIRALPIILFEIEIQTSSEPPAACLFMMACEVGDQNYWSVLRSNVQHDPKHPFERLLRQAYAPHDALSEIEALEIYDRALSYTAHV